MDEKMKKMIKISKLYYELQMSQKEISKKEGVSRATISRTLNKARKSGIVKIKIDHPLASIDNLEQKLLDQFSLKNAFVLPVYIDNEELILKDLASAFNKYIKKIIGNQDILGVSWGHTMDYISDNLEEIKLKDVQIVEMNGGIAQSSFSTSANTIIKRFAESYNADPYFLTVPAIVDNQEIVNSLLTDTNVKNHLKMAKEARIAVFSIGYVSEESVLYKSGYFDHARYNELLEKGAVGDICARFFDIHGKICDKELNKRTIGIKLNQFKDKEYSIAIATGAIKAEAILGALRGQYANVLITDEITARNILKRKKNI